MPESEEQLIESRDFSNQDLGRSSFTECTFKGCNFSEALLRNGAFSRCTFSRCNLSLVQLDGCRFQEVQFIDCKLVGGDFFKCDKTFFSVRFQKSVLKYCNFSDLNMKKGVFQESLVQECHFTNTVLISADFSGTDLAGTLFHHSDLSKADFSKAIHYTIDPQTNTLKKAKFSLPEAVGLLKGFDIVLV